MRKFVALLLVFAFLTASCAVSVKPIRAPSEDFWVSKAPMPTARADFGSAVVNGKIYVITGNSTEEYDPATGKWTSKKAMPTSRNHFAVAAFQDKIYVMGGINGSVVGLHWAIPVVTGINEVYYPETDTWETKASMPTPRSSSRANVVGEKMYLLGGAAQVPLGTLLPSGNPSNLNEVYDPSNDSWTSRSPMPTTVSHFISAVVDNKIYLIGGVWADPGFTDIFPIDSQVQIYDAETDNWTLGQPLPTPVYMAAGGATTGKTAPKRIYVLGGCTSNLGSEFYNGTNMNQVYDVETDSWAVGAQMPTPRKRLGVAVVNDTLYAMGGVTGSTTLATVEQYTPIGFGKESEPPPENLPLTWIIPVVALAATGGVASTIYYFTKKRKNQGR
jgi:N-acetylneuraminic acid mutarotase